VFFGKFFPESGSGGSVRKKGKNSAPGGFYHLQVPVRSRRKIRRVTSLFVEISTGTIHLGKTFERLAGNDRSRRDGLQGLSETTEKMLAYLFGCIEEFPPQG
jgi:hypothetical protein